MLADDARQGERRGQEKQESNSLTKGGRNGQRHEIARGPGQEKRWTLRNTFEQVAEIGRSRAARQADNNWTVEGDGKPLKIARIFQTCRCRCLKGVVFWPPGCLL